ncbi:MotA/TolQ/ExbB proton channel family protein [Desulfatitalea tepidiphila]|uniref:MotA/TolQ/ExbB proton channel family protein n=1 Tax=Desulfatitalea tepidiphila TaxID=1185843 RepID=UPI0006B4B449|nr:MotA/TolQ/ExbB proton channel family protein [Desulfatitalea tepidiphila]
MDLATIIGLIGGSILIVMAIVLGGSPLMFVNIPSVLIVVGGTFAVTFIKFKMSDVIGSIAVAMKAFLVKMSDPEAMIEEMVNFTRIAKKEGLIALEKEVASDPFAAKALRYLSDGYDEGLIEDMLSKDIRLTVQRHAIGQAVFKGMGDSAPAFGMIGTLIGLVQMLSSMDDPASIGPSMAVALLTTLYGAVLANFIFLPLADKLSLRSDQEKLNKSIIVEAAVGINRGISPMVLEESLKIFLSPKQRDREETPEAKAGVEAEAN